MLCAGFDEYSEIQIYETNFLYKYFLATDLKFATILCFAQGVTIIQRFKYIPVFSDTNICWPTDLKFATIQCFAQGVTNIQRLKHIQIISDTNICWPTDLIFATIQCFAQNSSSCTGC